MSVYLDASALVKLVFAEAESDALRQALRGVVAPVTSALSEVELMRVAHRGSTEHVTASRRVLSSVNVMSIGPVVIRAAGNLLPGTSLRSLDAIHLATATVTPGLAAVITYDVRMIDAAAQLGLAWSTPGR
ncbi:MAG: type II toxin-antitoxin system VapC family toxin [Candidatus Nanopelagicales bacterium]|nr:type II toxin-antitoxin system VapC family toxin [Candidatus Nanopelagicales bacterium]